jgi:transcription elongation factor B subunit 1
MPRSTVKLVSREGFEFIVDYKAACVSNTIRNMLSSQGEWHARMGRESPHGGVPLCPSAPLPLLMLVLPHHPGDACGVSDCAHVPRAPAGSFTETELGEVKFPEIPTPILEKVCQYFYYKLRYQSS